MLSSEIVDFLGGSLSLLVGSRDARNMPECARLVGVRVEPDRTHITVFLPEATGAAMFANFEDNGHIAVVASQPFDHRTIQLKGRVVSMERAPDSDRPLVEGCVARLAGVLDPLGMPRTTIERMTRWPARAIRMRVEELYQQTPGPGAGTRLTGGVT